MLNAIEFHKKAQLEILVGFSNIIILKRIKLEERQLLEQLAYPF